MYNFIDCTIMILDFRFDQTVHHTYFCDALRVRTWIDLILCYNHDKSVTSCNIIQHQAENCSDHLPVVISSNLVIRDSTNTDPQSGRHQFKYPPVTWSNDLRNDQYKKCLENKLQSIPLLDPSTFSDRHDAQHEIDTFLDKINSAFHESTKEAGCVNNNRVKPKPYWCPQLSFLRDRKRFWWSLWVANDRHRSGQVFQCWKGVKKLFGKVSRQCADNILNVNMSQYNTLFQQRKLNAFWNCIKKTRKNKCMNSNLQGDMLSHYYTGTMNIAGTMQ